MHLVCNYSIRVGKLDKASRDELTKYLELIKAMRYRTTRQIGDKAEYVIWSVAVV